MCYSNTSNSHTFIVYFDVKRPKGGIENTWDRGKDKEYHCVCVYNPTLFNVSLTSEPCAAGLNADGSEKLFV